MHVQTIFIEDLEMPLAPANCYFGLYIKTVYSQFVEDNNEGIMLKALFLSDITDVAQRTTLCLQLWQT